MRRLPVSPLAVAGLLVSSAAAGFVLGVATAGEELFGIRADAADTVSSPQGASAAPVAASPAASRPASPQVPDPRLPSGTRPAITLSVDRTGAEPFQTVTLTGTASPGLRGALLVVQRREGTAWANLPISPRVRPDGSLRASVRLGRPGPNVLRVALPDAEGTDGPASGEVVVTIG